MKTNRYMTFSLLQSAFLEPAILNRPDSWAGHVPFAFWLIEATRPDMLVELGTYSGNSYFSFCQSVKYNGLATRCYAIDSWLGDTHIGHYGEEVYQAVSEHNVECFNGFSSLLRMTFDEGLPLFENGSIDVLHIDGLHTYEAVKHDYLTWLPKLSSRGIVLFHDIAVKKGDFGVWQLWDELSVRYEHIEFDHSNGLGVIFVGDERTSEIMALLEGWGSQDERDFCKAFFERLGNSLVNQLRLEEYLEMKRQNVGLRLGNSQLETDNTKLRAEIARVKSTFSWHVTKPLRFLAFLWRKLTVLTGRNSKKVEL